MYVGFALANNWQTIADLLSVYGVYIGAIVVVIGIVMFRKWLYGVLKALLRGPNKK